MRDFLAAGEEIGPREYLESLEKRKDQFGGFSLLCVDLARDRRNEEGRMWYYSNRQNTEVVSLNAGVVHGMRICDRIVGLNIVKSESNYFEYFLYDSQVYRTVFLKPLGPKCKGAVRPCAASSLKRQTKNS